VVARSGARHPHPREDDWMSARGQRSVLRPEGNRRQRATPPLPCSWQSPGNRRRLAFVVKRVRRHEGLVTTRGNTRGDRRAIHHRSGPVTQKGGTRAPGVLSSRSATIRALNRARGGSVPPGAPRTVNGPDARAPGDHPPKPGTMVRVGAYASNARSGHKPPSTAGAMRRPTKTSRGRVRAALNALQRARPRGRPLAP